MSHLYGPQHREVQSSMQTTALADAVESFIVVQTIPPEHQAFIESRDLFFLTTVDHRGFPTCSYKGGRPGLIKVVDATTLAFPLYDGNGMFLSLGNLRANPKVGLLLIDFETPHRVRVHGTASVDAADPLLADYAEAQHIVRVQLEEMFINCPRYIHRYQRIASSAYVPQAACETPLASWKRIAPLQPVLDANTQAKALASGLISPEEYAALVAAGQA